jgi:hypothetical protein
MEPVKILADYDPAADGVMPESRVICGDVLVEHRLVMATETEFKGVPGFVVTGLIFIVVFHRKGCGEQASGLAAVGVMTCRTPDRRLVHELHSQNLLPDVCHRAVLPAFLHSDFPVMTA